MSEVYVDQSLDIFLPICDRYDTKTKEITYSKITLDNFAERKIS